MREIIITINEYPWTSFLIGMFICVVLDKFIHLASIQLMILNEKNQKLCGKKTSE